MPIDLAQVDWLYVVVLAVFAYFATFVGNLLSFNHRGAGCRAVGAAICGALCILDLLPASRAAAAEDADDTQFAGQHGHASTSCARRSGSTTKAAQSGHGYHASAQPGHRRYAARGSRDPARRPGALGLHATVRMMFSHDVRSIIGEEGRRAA